MALRRHSKHRIWFWLLLSAYTLYAGIFIVRSSFLIGGERYFSLFDDMMICMRYARNLATGHGLVWNPGGERVEGYTNPLWVLYMSLLHLLPVALSKISLGIQTTGAVMVLLTLLFVRRLSHLLSPESPSVALGAAVLTASYFPLNKWSLLGTEVSVLTLLVTASVFLLIRANRAGRTPVGVFVLLGTSTFIRPDMAALLFGVLLFQVLFHRSGLRRTLVAGLAILLACCAVQTVFRLWYYGDPLPNTYYLKVTGYPTLLRVARGVYVFMQFLTEMNPVLFLVPFGVLLFRRSAAFGLLAWIVLVQAAYSIAVGGDAWEWRGGANRFLCITMPCLFVLLSHALFDLSRALRDALRVRSGPSVGWVGKTTKWTFPVLVLFSVLNLNSLRQAGSLAQLMLLTPPVHADDNRAMVQQGLLLRRITRPNATIAVFWAGAIPYFAERTAVDLSGKNDRTIARHAVSRPLRPYAGLGRIAAFLPGHMKWDYAYSIGRLKPDIVAQLWAYPEEAEAYLEDDYQSVRFLGRYTFYLRSDSARILWDRVSTFSPTDPAR